MSPEQTKYAAIDAAVLLELAEELLRKSDLTRRLRPEELIAGKKVDLIPKNGNVACMATTRAAPTEIVGTIICDYPEGTVYGKGQHGQVKPGDNSYAIDILQIFSPALIVPGYKNKQTNRGVALGNIGKRRIIVPITMIKEHVDSVNICATPIVNPAALLMGRSKPVAKDGTPTPRPQKRLKTPLSKGAVTAIGVDEIELKMMSCCVRMTLLMIT